MAQRRKVVLYNPQAPFFTFPLPLLAISTMIDRQQYDIEIVDARIEKEPHDKVLRSLNDAICVGVTVLSGSPIRDALQLTKKVKEAAPQVPVVWGGWHPSIFPEQCLIEGLADITVLGQGEITFAEVVQNLSSHGDLARCLGIAYRDRSGVHRNPERPFASISSFPRYEYDLIPVERYFARKGVRQIDYYSSQGCPYRCSFCADPMVFNRKWSGLSAARILDEISDLTHRFKATEVFFHDETFFVNQKRVLELSHGLLERGSGITWAAAARADQISRLTDDMVALIKRANCRKVVVGAESGSQSMLDRIQKDTLVEETILSAEKLHRFGIGALFNFIVGFPEEEETEFRQTLAAIRHIISVDPSFEFSIFFYTPYPGTEIYSSLERRNYRLPRTLRDWSSFDYILSTGYWVSEERKEIVERFKFYHKIAFAHHKRWFLKPLHTLSRLRCKHQFYKYPFEQRLGQLVRHEFLNKLNW